MIPSLQIDNRSECDGTKSLENIVFEAGNLAALPQVILKLIDLTADPRVSAADVEKVIKTDQATTARVLTLANSSYYGLPRRISSVRDAVVFLGFKSVRSLAMQVTAFNMFLGKSDSISLGRRDLWRHSLYTALCTHVICKWLHPKEARVVDAEEAFTAGLLHDMGKMGIEISMPNEYAAAAEAAHNAGVRFHEIERDFLPYAHAVVGSAMADNWSLPDSLCDIILNHHTPMDSQISPQTTAIVTLADEISQGLHDRTDDKEDCQEHASSETFEQDPAEPVASEAATVLRLNDDAVQNINDACRLEMNKGIALSSF